MKPTYLYIKRHKITGKCYFGKTTNPDPTKYKGSGLHWLRHIKLHGIEHVETLWYKLFTDQEEITKVALTFSKQQDIVNSDLWLNLQPENGLDGGGLGRRVGSKQSEETKRKLSQIAKSRSEDHKIKLSKSLKEAYKRRKPEYFEKLSEAASKRVMSQETKDKISQSRKAKKKQSELVTPIEQKLDPA